jgi:hypothetical protein
MSFGPIFFMNFFLVGKEASTSLQFNIPKCLRTYARYIFLGQVKGMVCDVFTYLNLETKFYEVSISHFKCIREIRFDAL